MSRLDKDQAVPAQDPVQAAIDEYYDPIIARQEREKRLREILGFGPGDIVQLKSGGFAMTVVSFHGDCSLAYSHLLVAYCRMDQGPFVDEIDLPAAALQGYNPLQDTWTGRSLGNVPF